MTRREFRVRFRDVDAVAVEMLWNVFTRSTWEARGELVAALDRLEQSAQLELSARPRSMAP